MGEMKKAYIQSVGDRSVGIPPQSATVIFEDFKSVTDDDLRELTREQLKLAFQEIWDDGRVWVGFEDEEDEVL